jgi:hypothetical protein
VKQLADINGHDRWRLDGLPLVGETSFVTPMQTNFVVAAVGGIVMVKRVGSGRGRAKQEDWSKRKWREETKMAGKSAVCTQYTGTVPYYL